MRAWLKGAVPLAVCALSLWFPCPARPGSAKAARAAQVRLDGSLWLSSTTHNVYRVRVKDGTLSAEWVNIAPAEARLGAYIRTECHREGRRWVGDTSSYLRCETDGANQKPYVHWCHINTRTEIISISQDRITGRAEGLKRFDCRQCKVLEKEWKNFIWVRQK
ncbi:MAG: hypothetical protein ACRD1N_04640 [Terriglobia bacterium]